MFERESLYGRAARSSDLGAEAHVIEIGCLVAALSADTEDELELDDRVRAIVESGFVRVALGSHRESLLAEN